MIQLVQEGLTRLFFFYAKITLIYDTISAMLDQN